MIVFDSYKKGKAAEGFEEWEFWLHWKCYEIAADVTLLQFAE